MYGNVLLVAKGIETVTPQAANATCLCEAIKTVCGRGVKVKSPTRPTPPLAAPPRAVVGKGFAQIIKK
jgi:hypothetical protein